MVSQRWASSFGSVAYNIIDTNGYDGVDYLMKGARFRAFAIIQTVQSTCVSLLYFGGDGDCECGDWEGEGDVEGEFGKVLKAILVAIVFLPIIYYEIIIATKGSPVVMSGNCIFVELDPKLGFFDTEISNSWKTLVGITGL